MKRVAEHSASNNNSKRLKLDYEYADLFAEGLEKNALDILQHGTDGTGYISVKAHMLWPPEKVRMNIETTTSVKYRFDIHLSNKCVAFHKLLDIVPEDTFQISLRGVKVEKISESSAQGSLPMKLIYNEGVVIKWIKRSQPNMKDQNGTIVDVFKCECKSPHWSALRLKFSFSI
jgi:hypothetical protein